MTARSLMLGLIALTSVVESVHSRPRVHPCLGREESSYEFEGCVRARRGEESRDARASDTARLIEMLDKGCHPRDQLAAAQELQARPDELKAHPGLEEKIFDVGLKHVPYFEPCDPREVQANAFPVIKNSNAKSRAPELLAFIKDRNQPGFLQERLIPDYARLATGQTTEEGDLVVFDRLFRDEEMVLKYILDNKKPEVKRLGLYINTERVLSTPALKVLVAVGGQEAIPYVVRARNFFRRAGNRSNPLVKEFLDEADRSLAQLVHAATNSPRVHEHGAISGGAIAGRENFWWSCAAV